MAHLRVRLLGSFDVTLDGEPVTGFTTDKTRALLAYLAVESHRPHRREVLAGLLWPDYPERSARSSLRSALATVRQAIGDHEADPPFLHISRQTIQFNVQSDAWVDVRAFTDLVESKVPGAQISCQLEDAIALYPGDFLEGFSVPDSATFEEWALLTRESLRRLAVDALHDLVGRYESAGEYEAALRHAQHEVRLDPWRERAHRQLMRLLACTGQRSAALAQYETCRQLLATELGVEPAIETQETYAQLVRGEWPSTVSRPAEIVEETVFALPECPYRGLSAFREQDAPFFFGREDFSAQLMKAVQTQPLVTVIVGPSGSGKSSAVYAGLLPRLRGTSPGLREEDAGAWLITDCRPGSHPFYALATAVLRLLEPDLSETDRLIESRKLAEALDGGALPLYDVVEAVLEKEAEANRLLLIVDQFEELFTLCPEADERWRFLDALLEAVAAADRRRDSPLMLLLTMRADFMGQALTHREFADVLQEASLMMGPMNREELRAAIEKPAAVQGVAFEAGLVERLLDDVGEEPGRLPLLEFALTLLWESQTEGNLSHKAYEKIGRVEGALARYADQVYGELGADEREGARQVFVQLVRPGEGTEDTRRRATRAELGDAGADWGLVGHLADKKLVVTGRESSTGDETVEVVHEVLIQRWKRLQEWMAVDRAFRTWQERLRAALRAWETSQQDEGALLRGAPLAEAEGWLVERANELSEVEAAFINAGIALRERRQVQRERRRQRTILGLASGMVVAVALALLVGWQWQRAEDEMGARATAEAVAVQEGQAAQKEANLRATAEVNALRQASVGMALQALDQLGGRFPERAVPLALEALETYPYTWQAERALGQAVLESRLQLILTGHTDLINHVAWSPHGTQIATASDDGMVIVWDGKRGAKQFTLTGHREEYLPDPPDLKRVVHLAWSPDGTRIATAGYRVVKVWDAGTGEELLSLSGFVDRVTRVTWSPTGDRILTAHDYAAAGVWDAATGEQLLKLQHAACVLAVAWSPSGDHVASGDQWGVVKIWDAKTGHELFTLEGHKEAVNQVQWSPSGDLILTASDDHTVSVWDVSPSSPTYGEELRTLTGHRDQVWYALWSPSGDRVATASQDATTRVWDPATGELIYALNEGDVLLDAQTSAVVDWSPSGGRIAASRSDGSITVYDAASGDEILTLSGHAGQILNAEWSPGGDRIVTVGQEPTAKVWDVSPRARVLVGHTDAVNAVDWSPSGDRLATTSRDGTARIWDAVMGEEQLVMFGRGDIYAVEWSPSGDRIVTVGQEPNVQVWDASPSSPTYGEELLAIERLPGGATVTNISWSPTGDRFVTAGRGGFAKIWDASASSPTFGEQLLLFFGHASKSVTSADWSPDGERIVTSSSGDYALIWDPDIGETLLKLQAEPAEGWMTAAAWSPDGKRIATYSLRVGRVWDATTGELLQMFSGHSAPVWSIDWSASGDRLLTASEDETARIWDAQSGAELLSFSFNWPLWDAVWSPDMAHIAFGLGDGTVQIVDVHWHTREELIAYARECCLIRELTDDERELFGLPER